MMFIYIFTRDHLNIHNIFIHNLWDHGFILSVAWVFSILWLIFLNKQLMMIQLFCWHLSNSCSSSIFLFPIPCGLSMFHIHLVISRFGHWSLLLYIYSFHMELYLDWEICFSSSGHLIYRPNIWKIKIYKPFVNNFNSHLFTGSVSIIFCFQLVLLQLKLRSFSHFPMTSTSHIICLLI